MLINTIIIIIMVLCVLLALVILIQNPKGGGLSSSIGGFSNQTMGVQRTTEGLEKTTWYLMGAIAILVLITGTSLITPSVQSSAPSTEEVNGDLNKTYPGEPRIQQAPTQNAPAPLPTQGGEAQGTPAPAPETAPAAAPEATPEPSSSE